MVRTPDTTPRTPEVVYSDEFKAAFSPDTLEEWRSSEHDVLTDMRGHSEGLSVEYIADFHDGVNTRVEEFLYAKGIRESDPGYDDLRKLLIDAQLRNAGTGVGFTEDEWQNSPAVRGVDSSGDKSHQKVFAERVKEWRSSHFSAESPKEDDPVEGPAEGDEDGTTEISETTPPTDEEERVLEAPEAARQRNERIRELTEQLRELAEKKHHAYTNLQKARFRNRSERRKAYEEADRAYVACLSELMRLKTAGLAQDVRKTQYETEINRINTDDNDKQHEYLLEHGGTRVRLLERYANASTKKKILTGLGIGAAGLAGGIGLGFLFGAAGAVGAAAAAGYKGFRAFQNYELGKARLYQKREVRPFEYDLTNDNADEQVAAYYANETEALYEDNDKIHTNARTMALGGLALGATAGLLGGVVGTQLHTGGIRPFGASAPFHDGPTNNHWLGGYAEHRPHSTPIMDIQDGTGGSGVGSESSAGADQQWPFGSEDTNPADTAGGSHTTTDQLPHAGDHRPRVDKGEGLNEFVHENYGKTLTHQQSMELGKELHEQGFMYDSNHLEDRYGNPYGINHPGQVSVRTDATIHDMLNDSKLDDDYRSLASYSTNAEDVGAAVGSGNLDISDATVTPDTSSMTDSEVLNRYSDLNGLQSMSVSNVDWSQFKPDVSEATNYLSTGNLDALNNDQGLRDLRQYLYMDIGDLAYDNSSTTIMRMDNGNAVFNAMPNGAHVPDHAVEVMKQYQQAIFALAA